MPLYTFEDVETLDVIEHYAPMSESVPIGDETTIDGRRVRRICESSPEALVEPDWAHTAYSLGDEQIKFAPRTREIEGEKFAVLRNKREILDMEARCADAGITERYDLGIFRNR